MLLTVLSLLIKSCVNNPKEKRWRGVKEPQFSNRKFSLIKFSNSNTREQSYNSPENYSHGNTRYINYDSNVVNQNKTRGLNKKQYQTNIRRVYHSIDYTVNRNRPNNKIKKKYITNGNSENSSNSESLGRGNKAKINDFIFSTSQYQASGKDFETILNVKDAIGYNRRPNNKDIVAGLSSMKRRKKQQALAKNFTNTPDDFGLHTLHNKLPDK